MEASIGPIAPQPTSPPALIPFYGRTRPSRTSERLAGLEVNCITRKGLCTHMSKAEPMMKNGLGIVARCFGATLVCSLFGTMYGASMMQKRTPNAAVQIRAGSQFAR